MSRVRFALSILLGTLSATPLVAQLGSPDDGEPDSLREIITEELVEQAIDIEDSPLFDILPLQSLRPSLSGRSRFQYPLQRAAAYERGLYLGSAAKMYNRYRLGVGPHVGGGILLEKDPGERRMNDFTSGHLIIRDLAPMKSLIFGDYIIEAGQGLALWRGYDFGKGADVLAPVYRMGRSLVPYLSADEFNFFRGAAGQLDTDNLSLTLFYSKRDLSATLDAFGNVTSFYRSGYFRTDLENGKRTTLEEQLYGVRGRMQPIGGLEIGGSWYNSNFSHPLVLEGGMKNPGTRISCTAMDFRFTLHTVELFGEWGSAGAFGGISGVLFKPSKQVQMIGAFRRYPRSLTNLHGLPFGERTSNEEGFYVGLSLKTLRRVTLRGYWDWFNRPEPSSRIPFRSTGRDVFVQADARPATRLELSLRYQNKSVDLPLDVVNAWGLPHEAIGRQRTQRVRLQTEYRLQRAVRLRGRAEWAFLDYTLSPVKEKGFLLYQDIRLKSHDRLSWNARLIFFRTDSYRSAVYEYEGDLPGVLSVPGLWGRGVRWYLLVSFDISEHIGIAAKYSDLMRDDVRRLGTGHDQLPGNRDNRIGVQADFSW